MSWKYHDATQLIPTWHDNVDGDGTTGADILGAKGAFRAVPVFRATIQGVLVAVDPVRLTVYTLQGRLLGVTDPALTTVQHL